MPIPLIVWAGAGLAAAALGYAGYRAMGDDDEGSSSHHEEAAKREARERQEREQAKTRSVQRQRQMRHIAGQVEQDLAALGMTPGHTLTCTDMQAWARTDGASAETGFVSDLLGVETEGAEAAMEGLLQVLGDDLVSDSETGFVDRLQRLAEAEQLHQRLQALSDHLSHS